VRALSLPRRQIRVNTPSCPKPSYETHPNPGKTGMKPTVSHEKAG